MKMKKFLALILSMAVILSCCQVFPASAEVTVDREAFYADSISQYSDPSKFKELENFEGGIDEFLSDPQHIADEDFYGLWNEETNSWEKIPYLYYEMFPDMSEIEASAKAGDYDRCKEESLKYYRERFSGFNYAPTPQQTVSERNRARIEAQFNNFMLAYQNSISARIWFDKTDGWQSANILSDVKSKATSSDVKISKFQLVASTKDGYTAEIDTKESEFAPYVEVLVDGSYKKFPVIYDTYTCGLEPNVSQGQKVKMYVEESVSSIDAYREKDEYTKVSFLQFDFTGLTADNKITEARLYLHGKMVESDTPGGVRAPSDKKSVFVMPFIRGTSELDENMTYTTYSGYTNDYYLFDGNLSPHYNVNPETGVKGNNYIIMITDYLQQLVNGYAYTKDETFAWHAVRTLMGLIRNVGGYESMVETDGGAGTSIDGTFYVGQAGYELPALMRDFIHSECVTPDVMSTLIKHIWAMIKLVVTNWCSEDEGHNWGTYSNRGLCAFTMFFPEFRDAHGPTTGLSNEAWPGSMQGGWIEVAKYRLAYKVGDVILDGGASIEASIEYGIEAIVNLLVPMTYAEYTGADIKDYYSEEMIDILSKNTRYLSSHLNPWYGDWQVGDGNIYNMNHSKRMKKIMELTDDPEIEYLVTNGADGKMPDYLAFISDNVGKVTLRNSWLENAVAGHIENSGGYGTHGHNDDLSLTVAAYGQYLLIDPMQGLYDTKEANESWLSSTRGHNTVIINDTIGLGPKSYNAVAALGRAVNSQGVLEGVDIVGEKTYYPKNQTRDAAGSLYPENRETNNIYDFVRAKTNAYKNNNALKSDYEVIRDTLFMHKGYFIITDYINPEDRTKVNNYEQMWHFLPSAGVTIDADANFARSNFDNSANVAVATVNADEATELTLKPGVVAVSKSNFVNAPYANFEKNAIGTTTFNTIIYPMSSTEDIAINTQKLELDTKDDVANAFKAQVLEKNSGTESEIQFYTLFDEEEKAERKFGDYKTDATLALAEKGTMGYASAVIRGGKALVDTKTDSYLVYSTVNVKDLGVSWQSDVIDLSTTCVDGSDKVNLSELSICTNGKVSKVRLNGDEISFKQEGKYVYFGLNPLIKDETEEDGEEEEETETNSKPVHGSSGSGGSKGSSGGGGVSLGGTSIPTAPSAENTFNDSKGHWAEKYILSATKAGIVKGDEKGNFNPENKVTRAELISMVIRALDTDEEKVEFDNTFSDVAEDSWYAKSISAALSMGLISPSISFRPNDPINREEMCKILVGFAEKLGLEIEQSGEITFKDNDNISPWAKDYVKKAVSLGLMNGMEDNTFAAKSTANRAQAVTVIERAREKR